MRLTDITKELFDYLVAFRQKVAQVSVPDINVVRHELDSVFYSMEAKVNKYPQIQNEYRQVKYALVVLADEIILTSAWREAKQWEQSLLEKKYFQSNIAGNQFFKMLGSVEKMSNSVITIFFYCLAFGFRGGFSRNDPSVLRLKSRLLKRVLPQKEAPGEKVLPEAYAVDRGGTTKLPKLWKWRHLAIGAVVLFALLIFIERALIWPLLVGWSVDESEATAQLEISGVKGTAETAPEGPVAAGDGLPEITGYTAQLGSFKSATLAKHFSNQFDQQGIITRTILQKKTGAKPVYLVLSGTYNAEADAVKLVEKAKGMTTLVTEMSVRRLADTQGECIAGCN